MEQVGWGMFMVSAVFFGWSGIRSGDALVVAGSVVFGVACILFLLPSRAAGPHVEADVTSSRGGPAHPDGP